MTIKIEIVDDRAICYGKPPTGLMHGISISDAKLKKNYRGTRVKVTTRSLSAGSEGCDGSFRV